MLSRFSTVPQTDHSKFGGAKVVKPAHHLVFKGFWEIIGVFILSRLIVKTGKYRYILVILFSQFGNKQKFWENTKGKF
jgi:hypothetical protein